VHLRDLVVIAVVRLPVPQKFSYRDETDAPTDPDADVCGRHVHNDPQLHHGSIARPPPPDLPDFRHHKAW